MFYALICSNNHIFSCIICVLLLMHDLTSLDKSLLHMISLAFILDANIFQRYLFDGMIFLFRYMIFLSFRVIIDAKECNYDILLFVI